MPSVTAVARRRGTKRWIAALGLLLIAVAFVLPPLLGINRFQQQIAQSISGGLGRPVRMSSVKLRLLPRPGFEIADLVVEEDPAFGAEPVLRCSQVIAYVRLLPLWRGRLEIARIGFDEPSLNLVRNGQGRWNVDALLSQAIQAPKAPTGQRHAGNLPRFPYIDASNARVNFKFGVEKMPFSFLNADLAVWLQTPGEWHIQFAAQPVRTDLSLDLANTGIVRVEGSLRSAATLSQMPALLHAEWSNAPLGQLSRILTGSDADWRGELNAAADISGSADLAQLKVTATGQQIHRAEFDPAQPLKIDTICEAQFRRASRSFDAITCLAPTGEGHLLLTGSVHPLAGHNLREGAAAVDPELSLEINHLPVELAFDGVRLFRSGFAPAVQATGTVDGNFTYARLGEQPQLQGQAVVNGLAIAAPSLEKPLALPALHFVMAANPPEKPRTRLRSRLPAKAAAAAIESQTKDGTQEAILVLRPFLIALPNSIPASNSAPPANPPPGSLTAEGAFSRQGFSVHLGGEARIDRAIEMAREFRLLQTVNLQFSPKGVAELDLTVKGGWLRPVADASHPLAPVNLSGSLRLRNAELTGSFLAQPLQIASLQAILGENRIDWSTPAMTYGPVHADGSLSYAAFCELPAGCPHRFTLHLATLDASAAQGALLGATRHGQLLQELLDRIAPQQRSWPKLSGTIQVGVFTLGPLTVRDVAASLDVEGNSVAINNLSGRALSGTVRLAGNVQVTGSAPEYQIDAQLDHASMPEAAALFQEQWGAGSLSLKTQLHLSGFNSLQLASTATGKFHVDWADGGLLLSKAAADPDPLAPSDAPEAGALVPDTLSHFEDWSAEGSVGDRALTLESSRMLGGASVPIAGSITFDRELKLTSPPTSLLIGGTLERPLATMKPSAVPAPN